VPALLEANFGARVAVRCATRRAARAAAAFAGWRGAATTIGAGLPADGAYDAVVVDGDASLAAAAAARAGLARVVLAACAAADAPRVARDCRDAGAAVDVSYDGDGAVVVARRPAPSRKRPPPEDDDEEEEVHPLFMTALPRGGVAGNAGLAGLAALIDEDEGHEAAPPPGKRRRASLGETTVGLALL
jgi:hypothetical protein